MLFRSGIFSPSSNPDLFRPIVDLLLNQGDRYMLLADYASYVACQERVSELYTDRDEWTRRAILNTAGMGKFSSDRTITEYAMDIWKVSTLAVSTTAQHCLHEKACSLE